MQEPVKLISDVYRGGAGQQRTIKRSAEAKQRKISQDLDPLQTGHVKQFEFIPTS